MTKYISLIFRVLISAIMFIMLVWVNLNYFTAGTIIGSALFGGAFVLCVFWKPFCRLVKRLWSGTIGKIALLFFGTAAALCVGACVFFSVNMARYAECEPSADEPPQAVIVLGCQVRGETPSTMLAKRLDAALETLSEYPDALCVVSGGKGSGEDITEAEAMRRYLLERGVADNRIIPEDKSVSTSENIRFSASLLKERGIDTAVIITNEFHQYRADIYARRNGITAGHHSSSTPYLNLANYWVRELAALFYAVIL